MCTSVARGATLSNSSVKPTASPPGPSRAFCPGGSGIDHPAFYAYAYPEPPGFAGARVQPEAAFYHAELHEFVLPYDAVRQASDPDAALLAFLQTTYEAAATLRNWDRAALECPLGTPLIPRQARVPRPNLTAPERNLS